MMQYESDNPLMEEQTVTVTIRTLGEPCELSDAEILTWYRDRIEALLDPAIGTHSVDVALSRRQVSVGPSFPNGTQSDC